jgi:uncharacterized protein
MKFLLLLLTFLPLLAWSASFDCQKARSATEKMVCADSELSKLDEQLAQTYRKALKTLASPVKAKQIESNAPAKLTQEQKHWIAYVRNLCTDTACLREAYQSRIELLERDPSPFSDLHPTSFVTFNYLGVPSTWAITYPRDFSEGIIGFTKTLAQSGKPGKITNCNKIIYLAPGMGNPEIYVVAGVCTLENAENRNLIQICYSDASDAPAIIKTIDSTSASYKKLSDLAFRFLNGD